MSNWWDGLAGPELHAAIDEHAGLPSGSIAGLRKVAMGRVLSHLSGERHFPDVQEVLDTWPFPAEVLRLTSVLKEKA